MALQGPFFGKRDPDPTPTRPAGSSLGGTSSLGSAGGSAQPFAAPASAGTPASALAAAGVSFPSVHAVTA